MEFGFATINKQAMHFQRGIPQLYHDQLNVVGQHLWHLKHDPQFTPDIDEFLPLLEVLCKDPTLITKEEQVNLHIYIYIYIIYIYIYIYTSYPVLFQNGQYLLAFSKAFLIWSFVSASE